MGNKIGILTFHNAHNYGAVFQTLALYSFLKSSNFDVEVIDYQNKNIKGLVFNFKNLTFIKLINFIFSFFLRFKRFKNFNKFIELSFAKSEKCFSKNDIFNIANRYDYIVVGSDQVWNYNHTGEDEIDTYLLNFSCSCKKISYAASFGFDVLEDRYVQKYRTALSNFFDISVREKSAENILESILQKKVKTLIDPTLLLLSSEWDMFLKNIKPEKERYILSYSFFSFSREAVNYLSEKTGLKVVCLELFPRYKNVLRSAGTDKIESFINLIKNAEYVVTDSFHGTCFSIVYQKKFFSCLPEKYGSRIKDLLELLKIDDRIISSIDTLDTIEFNKGIDYENVKKILLKEREKAELFFTEALDG